MRFVPFLVLVACSAAPSIAPPLVDAGSPSVPEPEAPSYTEPLPTIPLPQDAGATDAEATGQIEIVDTTHGSGSIIVTCDQCVFPMMGSPACFGEFTTPAGFPSDVSQVNMTVFSGWWNGDLACWTGEEKFRTFPVSREGTLLSRTGGRCHAGEPCDYWCPTGLLECAAPVHAVTLTY